MTTALQWLMATGKLHKNKTKTTFVVCLCTGEYLLPNFSIQLTGDSRIITHRPAGRTTIKRQKCIAQLDRMRLNER